MYRIELKYSNTFAIEHTKRTGSPKKSEVRQITKESANWAEFVDFLGIASFDRLTQLAKVWDHEPTNAEVLEELRLQVTAEREREAAELAQRIEKREALIADIIATGPKAVISNATGIMDPKENPPKESSHWTIPNYCRVWDDKSNDWQYLRHYASRRPELKAVFYEAERLVEAQKAKIEAAESAQKKERESIQRDWILAHGSNRLKRCVAEGIKCENAYLEERLATERPGWVFYSDTPGKTSDPINPVEDAFALLDEARKTEPTAKLQWYSGGDGKGFVAEAEWLGDYTIIFGHSEIAIDEDDEE